MYTCLLVPSPPQYSEDLTSKVSLLGCLFSQSTGFENCLPKLPSRNRQVPARTNRNWKNARNFLYSPVPAFFSLRPNQRQTPILTAQKTFGFFRSEERRVGKECRSRWSP